MDIELSPRLANVHTPNARSTRAAARRFATAAGHVLQSRKCFRNAAMPLNSLPQAQLPLLEELPSTRHSLR